MSTDRQAVIDGLRELIDFLTEHPDVPVGVSTRISHCPRGTDEEQRADVDRVAKILGVEATATGSDYYEAVRWFGPVAYVAVTVSARRMAQHYAEASYVGVVQPETTRASQEASRGHA